MFALYPDDYSTADDFVNADGEVLLTEEQVSAAEEAHLAAETACKERGFSSCQEEEEARLAALQALLAWQVAEVTEQLLALYPDDYLIADDFVNADGEPVLTEEQVSAAEAAVSKPFIFIKDIINTDLLGNPGPWQGEHTGCWFQQLGISIFTQYRR